MEPSLVKAKIQGSEKTPYAILFFMTLLYFTAFTVFSINRHNRFGTSGFDLGIFDQAIWLLSRGEPAFVTVRGLHIFGDHASYIHLFTAPLFWLWDDVRALLVLQSFAIASGAVPIYLIARDRMNSRWSPLVFSAAYLMYPSLQHINLWQYHPETLGVPFLLWAFYFAAAGRAKPYYLFVALTLITKEEFALTVFLLGLFVAVKYDRRMGAVTSIAAVLWLLTVFKILLPYFNPMGYFRFSQGQVVFGKLGRTPAEVVANVFLRPKTVFHALVNSVNATYLFNLLAPVGFLAALSPLTLGVASLVLFTNMISDFIYMHLFNHHYTAIIIPVIFVATVYGVSNLKTRRLRHAALALLIGSTILGNIYLAPFDASLKNYRHTIRLVKNFGNPNPGYEEAAYQAISLIPEDASVSATPFFVPHLTHRKIIYEYPNPFEQANWGVADENPPSKDVEYLLINMEPLPEEHRQIVRSLLELGLFETVYEKNEILLLKKSFNSSLDEKYPLVQARLDPLRHDLAVSKKDYTICDDIKSTEIRGNCFREVAVKTEDYNLCAVKIKSQQARDQCYLDIIIATGDLNLCTLRIESDVLKKRCQETLRPAP
ncbi:MAG TPA: DUF2079 domain-containing protein [Euryarchaeota archaeon]|nr:DUF2079 domain-containing protein [Euryarchaeota archaeon]